MSSPNQGASKPLGECLREAGILSDTQVRIILYQQQRSPGTQFGRLLVDKGWVDQKTIDVFLLRQSRSRLLALLKKDQ